MKNYCYLKTLEIRQKEKKKKMQVMHYRILWSYHTIIEIKKPSYGLINYCKMFTHGRAICFWFSISFTDTDMEWLVSSFCVDGRFLGDLLPCDNAGKPDCFTLINHKIQLGRDKPGGTKLCPRYLIVLIIVLILWIIKILQITIWCGWNKTK